MVSLSSLLFFFNDTATTEIYTLSLHDALPICRRWRFLMPKAIAPEISTFPGDDARLVGGRCGACGATVFPVQEDRKSTRLNSSHANISYAVFCLNKKNI